MPFQSTKVTKKLFPYPEKFSRRNYFLLIAEGGLYMSGLTFVSMETVLPRMVEFLGGSTWMIAAIPFLSQIGCLGPQLFAPHFIEKMRMMKPFILKMGILNILPYLISGLFLLYFADSIPGTSLLLVILAFFGNRLFYGMSLTAYQELAAKTVPMNQLSSLWAIRALVTALLGFAVGKAVSYILSVNPGGKGFGLLHLAAFGVLALSYLNMLACEEVELPPKKENSQSWYDFIKTMPDLAFTNRQLRFYLLSRLMNSGLFIMTPFLCIHVLKILRKTDSFLGVLLMGRMLGALLGNVVAAFVGDRYSNKGLLIGSNLLYIMLCGLVLIDSHEWFYITIFILFGFGDALNNVGVQALAIEISPERKRISYLALMGVVTLLGTTAITILNIGLQAINSQFQTLAVISGLMMVASFVCVLRIKDPR